MAFENLEVTETLSWREWAILDEDNLDCMEQIGENSTRADLKLVSLHDLKLIWSLSAVFVYTLLRHLSTSVQEDQRNPLESRLIGLGISHYFWECDLVALEWLITSLILGLSKNYTQVASLITPSQFWVEMERGVLSPLKSLLCLIQDLEAIGKFHHLFQYTSEY